MEWLDILSRILNWLIPALLGAISSGAIVALKSSKVKDAAISKGLKCLLRGELIRYHKEFTTKGYCTVNERRVFDEMYDAYHDLDGNDVITALKNEVDKLPTYPNQSIENIHSNGGN